MIAAVPHWTPSAVVCAGLVVIAGIMIRSHRRTWANRQAEGLADPADLFHYHNQYRRRIQSSLLMALIGVMILVGDLITLQMGGLFFGAFWLIVLGLVGYLITLALLDALATMAHTRAALARLRAQRRQLERHAAELRERPQATEWP